MLEVLFFLQGLGCEATCWALGLPDESVFKRGPAFLKLRVSSKFPSVDTFFSLLVYSSTKVPISVILGSLAIDPLYLCYS